MESKVDLNFICISDKYKKIEKEGEGGFGAVYTYVNVHTEEVFALKI